MLPTLTRHDELAVITLNRPEALNALSFEIIGRLAELIDEAAASDARALLFIGSGERAFCAGADIAELMGRSLDEARRGAERGQQTFAKLDRLAIPSIAVINGFAFGGGLELASACTLRLATAGAKMGLPEIKLGLIPGYGGTQRLPRLVGHGKAMEMILTGRAIGAEEALAAGLVSRIVEGDPLEAGLAFAREITGHGLIALKLARDAVMRAGDTPLGEGLQVEADLSALVFQTEDAAEGTSAFLEKRPARFSDR